MARGVLNSVNEEEGLSPSKCLSPSLLTQALVPVAADSVPLCSDVDRMAIVKEARKMRLGLYSDFLNWAVANSSSSPPAKLFSGVFPRAHGYEWKQAVSAATANSSAGESSRADGKSDRNSGVNPSLQRWKVEALDRLTRNILEKTSAGKIVHVGDDEVVTERDGVFMTWAKTDLECKQRCHADPDYRPECYRLKSLSVEYKVNQRRRSND